MAATHLMQALSQFSSAPAIAKQLAAHGRGNDTLLAHISPKEALILKRLGGSGTRNPVTGLLEFDDSGDFNYNWSPDYSLTSGTSGRSVLSIVFSLGRLFFFRWRGNQLHSKFGRIQSEFRAFAIVFGDGYGRRGRTELRGEQHAWTLHAGRRGIAWIASDKLQHAGAEPTSGGHRTTYARRRSWNGMEADARYAECANQREES